MADVSNSGLYPDDGSDFYVDEFGERIETPGDKDSLTTEDAPEPELDTDSLMDDEPIEDIEPGFRERLGDDSIDEKIIEED